MSKYDPLMRHLGRLPASRIAMRFEEIEALLGFELPASSRKHRGWWSNNPRNNVMTRSWLDAGFETEAVDIDARRLVFRRARAAETAPRPKGSGRPPIFGCMQGSVTLAAGLDLTAPADPDWGEAALGPDGLD